MTDKRILIRIPQNLSDDLDREAKDRGVPRNQIIIDRLSGKDKTLYPKSVVQFIEDIVNQVIEGRSKK